MVTTKSYTLHIKGWPKPHIYGVYTVILAGKSPNIRSYTEYIYSSGQPYIYTVLVNPSYVPSVGVLGFRLCSAYVLSVGEDTGTEMSTHAGLI